jgi:hypothetical protein
MYEATEGGAGVLTRLVAEPGKMAEIAREALSIMHFDLGEEGDELPTEPGVLRDVADSACVAACYRCLLSYYNQPEHGLLDRRLPDVREMVLRLARARTVLVESKPTGGGPASTGGAGQADTSGPAGTAPVAATLTGRWLDAARAYGIPSPDARPLVVGDSVLPLVWREQYVLAVLGDVPSLVTGKASDLGFACVAFGATEESWTSAFDNLKQTLGR